MIRNLKSILGKSVYSFTRRSIVYIAILFSHSSVIFKVVSRCTRDLNAILGVTFWLVTDELLPVWQCHRYGSGFTPGWVHCTVVGGRLLLVSETL